MNPRDPLVCFPTAGMKSVSPHSAFKLWVLEIKFRCLCLQGKGFTHGASSPGLEAVLQNILHLGDQVPSERTREEKGRPDKAVENEALWHLRGLIFPALAHIFPWVEGGVKS